MAFLKMSKKPQPPLAAMGRRKVNEHIINRRKVFPGTTISKYSNFFRKYCKKMAFDLIIF
jgi:hypothetical protein